FLNSGWRSAKVTVRDGVVETVRSADSPSRFPASLTAGAGEITVDGRLVPALWQPGTTPTARMSAPMINPRFPRIAPYLLFDARCGSVGGNADAASRRVDDQPYPTRRRSDGDQREEGSPNVTHQ